MKELSKTKKLSIFLLKKVWSKNYFHYYPLLVHTEYVKQCSSLDYM